jgi:hypothetical protein
MSEALPVVYLARRGETAGSLSRRRTAETPAESPDWRLFRDGRRGVIRDREAHKGAA